MEVLPALQFSVGKFCCYDGQQHKMQPMQVHFCWFFSLISVAMKSKVYFNDVSNDCLNLWLNNNIDNNSVVFNIYDVVSSFFEMLLCVVLSAKWYL